MRRLYRWLVRRLPPRAAWAIWRAGVAAAAARRRAVPGPEVEVAQVAWGASESELEQIVARLVEGSGAPPSHLLVVSDCDAVHAAAARGCRLEHVPAAGDWERRFPSVDYDAFLASRGHAIRAAYRIRRLDAGTGTPEALRLGLAGADLPALGGPD